MSFHFPTFRLPSISLPSFGEIRARFTAFTGKIASKLQALRSPSNDPVKSLGERHVQSATSPSPSPLKSLQQPDSKHANALSISEPKEPAKGSHAHFEPKLLNKPVTLDSLPKKESAAIVGHPDFKAFAHDFANVLLKTDADEAETALKQDLAPRLHAILDSDMISGATKLALTLDGGKAFMESLKDAIVKQAPPGKANIVSAEFDNMGANGGLKSFYNDAAVHLGGSVGNLGRVPGENTTLTINGVPYTFVEKLGEGGFASVTRFKSPGKPDVVMKVPKQAIDHEGKPTLDGSLREGRGLANAIATGASAQNVNTLEIPIRTDDGRVVFILSLAEHGSLDSATKLLDKAVDQGLDASIAAQLKLTAIQGLADAIARVHAKGIEHFDIATRNVMIDKKGVSQLADFGLAEEFENEAPTDAKLPDGGRVLPLRWAAPEAIKGKNITTAADTYSFGMALWEVVYGKIPLHDEQPAPGENPAEHLLELAGKLARGELDPAKDLPEIDETKWPPPLNAHVKDLLQKTLQRDPTLRPPMSEVRQHPALTFGITGTPEAQKQLADTLGLAKPAPSSPVTGENYGIKVKQPTSNNDANNDPDGANDRTDPRYGKATKVADDNRLPPGYIEVDQPVPGYGQAKPVADYDVYVEPNLDNASPVYAQSPANLQPAPPKIYAKSPAGLKTPPENPSPSAKSDASDPRYDKLKIDSDE